MKTFKRSGDESTIRKVKDDSGNPVGIYGQVKDMQAADLLIGDYSQTAEKWIFIPVNAEFAKEFDSKETVKAYIEAICQ